MQIFNRLGWFFKLEKKSYILGVSSLFVIALLNLIPPKIIGMMIDKMTSQTLDVSTLVLSITIIFVNAFIIFGLRYVWRIYIFGSAFRLERILRLRLFEHFTKMSSSFFQTYRVGDLMAHATNDLKSVQAVAGAGVLQFADALITGISVLLAMFFGVSFKLTLIILIPMPLMIIGAQLLGKKLYRVFHVAQKAFSGMNNRAHESVAGIKVTKTFNQEQEEIETFKEVASDVYVKNRRVALFNAAFDPFIEIIMIACYVLLFIFGAKFIQAGELTIGNLVTMVSYMNMFIWPMLAFGFLYNTIERGNVSYNRIEALFAIEAEVQDVDHPIHEVVKGSIHYDLDAFTYSAKVDPVLQDIHFELAQGETLGLVGKTGAGKTTLIKLLLREYNHYDGSIMIGKHEINSYALATYHQSIGYVPQDQFLFSLTIEENIRFGNPNATKEQVIAAAKMASVHDDIIGFEKGYDTLTGERGVSLSGGQKQRIAIARALILDPEILILDDSLSAVDAKTEERILQQLKVNREGKTTIIIAHRFSAIKHAHQIIVLEDGKVAERGKHEQLIQADGWYAAIFKQQELSQGSDENESV